MRAREKNHQMILRFFHREWQMRKFKKDILELIQIIALEIRIS